jgi:hypothetical protein
MLDGLANDITTLAIGRSGNRTSIDDIHIGSGLEIDSSISVFGEFRYQLTAFGIIEFTSERMYRNAFFHTKITRLQ